MKKNSLLVNTKIPVWFSFLLFLAVLLLHFITNSVHISDKFFWLDECLTYWISSLPIEKMLSILVNSIHKKPPLYFLLSHFIIPLGDSPLILRSISFCLVSATLAFVILSIRELSLPSRVVLCMLLILSPYGCYVSTEFRPYSMAVFFILTSNVFLFRAIKNPSRCKPVLLYTLCAIGLQYSTTLNCWVFGCQMAALVLTFLYHVNKNSPVDTLINMLPLLIIALFLCATYIGFLILITRTNQWGPQSISFWTALAENTKSTLIHGIILGRSRWGFIATGLLVAGIMLGLVYKRNVSMYLIAIFFGQLLFSTYIMYSRIPGFFIRYLTSSYVAFAMLGALGFELLIAHRIRVLALILATLLLMVSIVFQSIYYYKGVQAPKFVDPWKTVLNELKCSPNSTLVLCSPEYLGVLPSYQFRNTDEADIDIINFSFIDKRDPLLRVEKALNNRECILFFLMQSHNSSQEQKIKKRLLQAGGYKSYHVELWKKYPQYKSIPHFPQYLFVFNPLERKRACNVLPYQVSLIH